MVYWGALGYMAVFSFGSSGLHACLLADMLFVTSLVFSPFFHMRVSCTSRASPYAHLHVFSSIGDYSAGMIGFEFMGHGICRPLGHFPGPLIAPLRGCSTPSGFSLADEFS